MNKIEVIQTARRTVATAPTEALEMLEPISVWLAEEGHLRIRQEIALIRTIAEWDNGHADRAIAEASLFLALEGVSSESNPSDRILVCRTRGQAHVDIGEIEKGLEDFDTALQHLSQQDSDQARAGDIHVDKGTACLQLYRYDEAISAFQKASDLMPDNLQPLYYLAVLYTKKDELEAALEKFSDACNIAPDNPDTWFNRGCALANLSRYEDAERDFSRAIALRADYVYYHNRAVIRQKLDKRGDATNDWIIRCYLYPPAGEPDMDKEDLIQPGDGAPLT